jgi:soluble lytic murein transglycosylase
MPFDVEEEILETFGDLITRADDKARMEHWLYTNDTDTALRAAIRFGGNEPAIVKARAAVNEKASNAKALIEALPSSARQDAGVVFKASPSATSRRLLYLTRFAKPRPA